MRARAAFTLIELLTVITIIGLLARISIPRYTDFKQRGIAAGIVADLHQVRTAAFQAYTDDGSWPGESAAGVVPQALAPNLTNNLSFDRGTHVLDWDVLNVSGATSVAITVRSTQAPLIGMVARQLGTGAPHIVTSDSYTWIIEGASAVAEAIAEDAGSDPGNAGNSGNSGPGNACNTPAAASNPNCGGTPGAGSSGRGRGRGS